MGKRSGVTKSGRVMNPADRERKQNRLKELKRNKKERVKIRQAIVKSRDPQELIEHLERLDDQEFDPSNELAANVIADKRTKYRGAFIQMIALYRTEKNEKEVKALENMLHDYELERFKKEQHYRALMFSEKADPDEIPLPIGSMAPNAALTPFAPPPLAPQFHPTMKAGILKKSAQAATKKHKYPPGPPCGLPPSLSDDEEEKREFSSRRSRKVKFSEPSAGEKDEMDYGPVDIPESMLAPEPQSHNQSSYTRMAPQRSFGGLPIPPQMAPQPPSRMPGMYRPGYQPNANLQELGEQRGGSRGQQQYGNPSRNQSDEPNSSVVISAGPQVIKPAVDIPSTDPIIMAAPQMRNLKRETTRFVPTALRVSRPAPPPVRRMPAGAGSTHISSVGSKSTPSQRSQANKSTDQACDDFLKEIQDLL